MSETPQDYPNIRAMASGTISGTWREWPKVRPEAKALLDRLDGCHKAGEQIALAVQPRQNELVAEAVGRVVAERDTLRAAVHEGRIRWTAALNHAEKAEAALREGLACPVLCPACGAISDVRLMLATADGQVGATATLRDTAPAEQSGSPELRRVMGMGIPFEEQIEPPREEKR
jgi:hypothetical protein